MDYNSHMLNNVQFNVSLSLIRNISITKERQTLYTPAQTALMWEDYHEMKTDPHQ